MQIWTLKPVCVVANRSGFSIQPLDEGEFPDLKIICKNASRDVHKPVLGSQCEVFRQTIQASLTAAIEGGNARQVEGSESDLSGTYLVRQLQ
jgi:hypothetical protein